MGKDQQASFMGGFVVALFVFVMPQAIASRISGNINLYFEYFFQVHKGVHGFVKDKTGKPISKAVIVLNEGIKVHTKEGGYFHVLLAPGVHNINAIADGYQQQHSQVRNSN